MSASRSEFVLVSSLLVAHGALLAVGAATHSPTWDEPGHLAAGISHWKLGTFRAYHVNPPLVRMAAALPVLAVRHETDWSRYSDGPYNRPEYSLGHDLVQANREKAFQLFTLARLACIPFSIAGAVVSWAWARELYGRSAGIVALSLWSFCPNILAHGQQLTPDVAATALGLTANYFFWKWIRDPRWSRVPLLGLAFGLTQLTKFTWIILFGLWPLIWLIKSARQRRIVGGEALQLGACFIGGIYVVNCAYAFSGTFTLLGDCQFISKALGGSLEPRAPGNRFQGNPWQYVPIPLPHDYVAGIDSQKYDFDRGLRSYLRGTWSDRGWWHYYLYGLAIKMPLGTWLIILLAGFLMLTWAGYAVDWLDEAMLLIPALGILILVSSQAGFSHHLRYVLPSLPFVYVWASKCARSIHLKSWCVVAFGVVSLLWSIGSSLWVYPHSLSYFNELVGGPKGGHWHLGGSNTDWGQDLLLIKRWYDEHPEARPFHLAYELPLIRPELARIVWQPVPTGPIMNRPGSPKTRNWPWGDELEPSIESRQETEGPTPGWHVLGINQIHRPSGDYEYFMDLEPVAMIGYSTYVYNVSLGEANRLRRKLGLLELAASPTPINGVLND